MLCGTQCASRMMFGVSIRTPLFCIANTARRSSLWKEKRSSSVSKQLHRINASMALMATPIICPKFHGSRPWTRFTATSKAFVRRRRQCLQASRQESLQANRAGPHSPHHRQTHRCSPATNPASRHLHRLREPRVAPHRRRQRKGLRLLRLCGPLKRLREVEQLRFWFGAIYLSMYVSVGAKDNKCKEYRLSLSHHFCCRRNCLLSNNALGVNIPMRSSCSLRPSRTKSRPRSSSRSLLHFFRFTRKRPKKLRRAVRSSQAR
mmetsp:Transcript_1769/g.5165  ORF Transcript_1769/g.5165 Transcript_1769/m.5165 type:complete len:262 (-) Transcript_1769:1424-2209(-)